MKLAARIFSTFFGTGFIPLAPGTAASLVVSLLYKFSLSKLSWPFLGAIVLFLAFSGAAAATIYSRELGQSDPRRIVIDEAAGQLAVFFLAPADWFTVGTGFLLFRAFDVIKPFPLRRLERLPAGWGIMADDLGAAAYAWALLRIFLLIKGTSV